MDISLRSFRGRFKRRIELLCYVDTQPCCTHLLGFVSEEDLHIWCCLIFQRENKEALFTEDDFLLLATVDVPS